MTQEPTFQLPPAMSTFAARYDETYYFIYWLSVLLFVGIIGAAAYFVWKYRRRPGVDAEPTGHNAILEASWTIAPIIILAVMFHVGFRGYLDMAIAPGNALEVRVRAWQWGWDFEYQNGAHSNDLKVPVNKPVKLIMSSNDVIHSLFVPAFRIKKDVVPGMYTTVWFEATSTGETDLYCAEYCGKDHSAMMRKVIIVTDDEFQKFLEESSGPPSGMSTEDWGNKIYGEKCKSCHSLDGSKVIGPTFKHVWGEMVTMTNGEIVKVDENYVRESILDPLAKVVAGYAPVMPTFKGTLGDKEIDALIKFIQTVK